ncbi:YciI family protein [Marinobacter sp. LN3S78]|uniref:YciI family protein n=1 Tax=Marinobacter sp. LN3S78 TaxID=3382300 RepID=UPI00387B57F4
MKFMLIRRADEDTEQGVMPSDAMLEEMARYNERMTQAGVFVSGEGLWPSREGYRINFHDGEPDIVKGPLAEPDALIAGFSVLEVDSVEEALDWARQWPTMDRDGNTRLELRRFYELEDFDPGEGLDRHRRLQTQLARQPQQVNTHLVFNGQCREAMTFYADLLGGEIEAMIAFSDTPVATEVPEDSRDRIAHSVVNIRDRRLMGCDMNAECYTPPAGACVQLEYGDVEGAEQVFRQLSDGGTIQMPFEETFWAVRFGVVVDRYGIGWMINVGKPEMEMNP